MAGSVFKRCGCRDSAGRLVGAACPQLRAKNHGTWSFKVELPATSTGRRRTGGGGFRTRREAEAALTEVLDRVNNRTYVEVGRQCVGDYLEQWIAGKAALRSTTSRSYREHLDLYLIPALGHVRLSELTERHIEAMYAAMGQLGHPDADRTPELEAMLRARRGQDAPRPLSAARVQRVHATLRAALNSGVKRRLIGRNPALHVELRRGMRPRAVVWTEERTGQWSERRETGRVLAATLRDTQRRQRQARRRRDESASAVLDAELARLQAALAQHQVSYPLPKVAVWTPTQTGHFLDTITAHRLYALYYLVAFRGLRRGEAVGLRWADVDLDHAELIVATQVVQLGYATDQCAPKADSEGVVALDSSSLREPPRVTWSTSWSSSASPLEARSPLG